MVSFFQLICVSISVFLIHPISSQQFYDGDECRHLAQVPGSNYLCNAKRYPCQTFIIYRAQQNFISLNDISSLFQINSTEIASLNNLTNSSVIRLNQELVVPVSCSCSRRFSQAFVNYTVYSYSNDLLLSVACDVFEGLVKAQSLMEQNPNYKGNSSQGDEIVVPIRCACPANTEKRNGVKYLVTYPIIVSDNVTLIADKFGVDEEKILLANTLEPAPTIYPQTTLLIPMEEVPILKLKIVSPVDPAPGPRQITPLETIPPNPKKRNSSLALGLGVSVGTLVLVLAFSLLVYLRRMWHCKRFEPLSAKSSQLSNFSADFLDGILKLKNSLLNFSIEELQLSTGGFCEASKIGSSVYHGRIGGSHLAIEQMTSEEAACQVVDIMTKINHLNIVRLDGYCYDAKPYLVFQFATNGSLRSCLSDAKVGRELTWPKRMQIAFDLAVGLHYLHHCTNPLYVHRNINSRHVLINSDWRAKISGFKWAKALPNDEAKIEKPKSGLLESLIVGRKGYLAPEYIYHGQASSKVDVFAFGVVLLELMSAKEAIMQGCMLKDSIGFMVEGALEGYSGCLEKLKEFMDPALEGIYPMCNALCLALLAKGCVEEDPNRRPTMNDVLKALSRII